jgi:hypothetical protein
MLAEWLVEAHYVRIFVQLSKMLHFITLQKFVNRINNVMLGTAISSFVVLTGTRRHVFVGIDSTGFNITRASQCYTERAKLRRTYAKLSIGDETFCRLKGSRTHMENSSQSMVKQTKKSLDVEFVDVIIYDPPSPLSHGIH